MLIPLEKLAAIVHAVTKEDVEAMPPSKRQWIAQTLRHIADIADPPQRREPTTGRGLADLRAAEAHSAGQQEPSPTAVSARFRNGEHAQ